MFALLVCRVSQKQSYVQTPDVTGISVEGFTSEQFWSSESKVKVIIRFIAAGAHGVPEVTQLDLELRVNQNVLRGQSSVTESTHR